MYMQNFSISLILTIIQLLKDQEIHSIRIKSPVSHLCHAATQPQKVIYCTNTINTYRGAANTRHNISIT